ncbi:MAG TPA: ATP-binding protein, partial [Caldithrix abyssi]|nr:ATP-binding protein [Caldithrix abyssi]
MQGYITRSKEKLVLNDLSFFPVVAVIGPRQSGKSTMIKAIAKQLHHFVYLDLERPADLNKLEEPDLFFEANHDKTICLDEIQRKPDLFPVMRSFVDRYPAPGRFIVLGSSSPDLLKQSSESLAGRISYIELTPFLLSEVALLPSFNLHDFWLRGGFPRSYLAPSLALSYRWRENFITTFIERDIPQLGFASLSPVLHRFMMLCANSNAQVANFSKLGEALSVSHHTAKRYLDVLQKTYLIRILQPFHSNIKKRLIKSPKIYFRDSGILTALLGIKDFNDLLGHPIFGSSWETFALENILSELSDWQGNFYRASGGAEIDLILSKG